MASRLDRETSDMSSDNYFAQIVGPDQLHHLESRAVERPRSISASAQQQYLENRANVDRQRSVSASGQQHSDADQLGTPAVAQPQRLPSIAETSAPPAPPGTTGEQTNSKQCIHRSFF